MPAPIKHTCPDIDKAIKLIRSVIKDAENSRKIYDIDDIREIVKYIAYDLDSVEGLLEDLRSSNSSLRDWGDDCEKQISELELQIDDLETQLQDT